MTADRARAHARVTKTLRDLGPAKLLPAEQARIRLAADTLVFSTEPGAGTLAARADMTALCRHLAASGRWLTWRADELLADLWDCGPSELDALAAAA
jgi:hypothetical protein